MRLYRNFDTTTMTKIDNMLLQSKSILAMASLGFQMEEEAEHAPSKQDIICAIWAVEDLLEAINSELGKGE